jgi:aryl-phospho-beta-D-glucosidase BglC (GH1 family)
VIVLLKKFLADTFSSAQFSSSQDFSPEKTYEFSSEGIAWSGEANKYIDDPVKNGEYSSYDELVPPPNWPQFNGTYTEQNMPNLKANLHFQNWMRTAGLPTFTKLYGRNDNDKMEAGWYEVVVGLSALLFIFLVILFSQFDWQTTLSSRIRERSQ